MHAKDVHPDNLVVIGDVDIAGDLERHVRAAVINRNLAVHVRCCRARTLIGGIMQKLDGIERNAVIVLAACCSEDISELLCDHSVARVTSVVSVRNVSDALYCSFDNRRVVAAYRCVTRFDQFFSIVALAYAEPDQRCQRGLLLV